VLIYLAVAWVVVIPLIVVVGGAVVRHRSQADESPPVPDQPMPARELREITSEPAPKGPAPTA
jgi:hypothetical protein